MHENLSFSLRGRLLTPVQGQEQLVFFGDASLRVVDGRIAFVGHFDQDPGPHDHERAPGVIVPGWIDTHIHYPQTRVVGRATGPLLQWLEETVFPEESRFRDRRYAAEVAREFIGRMVHFGTTTACIYSSSDPGATDVLFNALAASGLRGLAGLTLMDQSCPEALKVPVAPAMEASTELVARWHGHDDGRLQFVVTPRFAISCTAPLLTAAGHFARDHDLLIQTHLAEHVNEEAATLALHPAGASYLDVYRRTGLLSDKTIYAHAIYLTDAEWDAIAETGARIAHCPDSNFFLGSGRMSVESALGRGVSTGLGSDVAAGRSFNVRRAIASAYDNALCRDEDVTPDRLIRMATLGGAEVLGIAETTGSLEVGKDADLVVIDLPEYIENKSAIISYLAFCHDDHDVGAGFVRGRQFGGSATPN